MFCVRTKGQSTLEYVILLGFVVAALIAMGVYMKRGVQGRLRQSTDQVGEQYSAKQTTGTYITVTNMSQNENMLAGGETTTNILLNSQVRTGNEYVGAFSTETE